MRGRGEEESPFRGRNEETQEFGGRADEDPRLRGALSVSCFLPAGARCRPDVDLASRGQGRLAESGKYGTARYLNVLSCWMCP